MTKRRDSLDRGPVVTADIPLMPVTRLTFAPGNHAYYLRDPDTGKKQRVTSVTTLLGLLAKPALVKWAARCAADYACDNWDALTPMPGSERQRLIASAPDLIRNAKAAKGTAIHDIAERMLAGESVEVDPELVPKVDAVARWWERQTFARVATERMVWSGSDEELGLCAYSGKFDLLVDCPRRGLGLLDWKTGSGVYGDMAVQLAGYIGAENHVIDGQDKPAPLIQWGGVVHIRPDGCDLHTLDAEQLAIASQRFELLRAIKFAPFPAFNQEA